MRWVSTLGLSVEAAVQIPVAQALYGNDDFVHGVSFSPRNRDRNTTAVQHHGTLRVVDEKLKVPKWLRSGTRKRASDGREVFMASVIARSNTKVARKIHRL